MAAVDELERGRGAYADRAWLDAWDALTRADEHGGLGGDDLELLATAAYMLGRDADYLTHLERAHRAHLDAGAQRRAAHCAFWVGMHQFMRGAVGPGSGWLGRAQRLLEHEGDDCAERGFLLLPQIFRHEAAGECDKAIATAGRAADAGERLGVPDLFGLAVHQQGILLLRYGDVDDGLRRLDEAMVSVTAGELSPIPSGIVYCGVILGCQEAFDVRRAQEWTAALTAWTEGQPDMVAFTGRCLLHRAELLQLEGAWDRALVEARRAETRSAQSANPAAAAEAVYREGDVHRLRGDFVKAQERYREAGRRGREAQPGLALLRLAQGDAHAAGAGIRRALAEARTWADRAALLPAFVEIALADDDVEAAREGAGALAAIAAEHPGAMLAAMAAHATGAVRLAGGDVGPALTALRQACHAWQELGAPYAGARARELVALACRELGDEDAAAVELEAAAEVYGRLGAAPDSARVAELDRREPTGTHGLTDRELQVLRLVASGRTNRAIAQELVLSERTVDRHVSNIFAKLRVSSRAAATAFAYEHGLVG